MKPQALDMMGNGRATAYSKLPNRYFFFFFVGLCAAHVSHIELSPPGRVFGSSSSALRCSVLRFSGPVLWPQYRVIPQESCLWFSFYSPEDYPLDVVIRIGERQDSMLCLCGEEH